MEWRASWLALQALSSFSPQPFPPFLQHTKDSRESIWKHQSNPTCSFHEWGPTSPVVKWCCLFYHRSWVIQGSFYLLKEDMWGMSKGCLSPESGPLGKAPLPPATFSSILRMHGYPSRGLWFFPSLSLLNFAWFTFQILLFAQLIDCTRFQTWDDCRQLCFEEAEWAIMSHNCDVKHPLTRWGWTDVGQLLMPKWPLWERHSSYPSHCPCASAGDSSGPVGPACTRCDSPLKKLFVICALLSIEIESIDPNWLPRTKIKWKGNWLPCPPSIECHSSSPLKLFSSTLVYHS